VGAHSAPKRSSCNASPWRAENGRRSSRRCVFGAAHRASRVRARSARQRWRERLVGTCDMGFGWHVGWDRIWDGMGWDWMGWDGVGWGMRGWDVRCGFRSRWSARGGGLLGPLSVEHRGRDVVPRRDERRCLRARRVTSKRLTVRGVAATFRLPLAAHQPRVAVRWLARHGALAALVATIGVALRMRVSIGCIGLACG
jgi:hypothetical protein